MVYSTQVNNVQDRQEKIQNGFETTRRISGILSNDYETHY